ncbi:uncharacterized protein LOC127852411 [Dreissena polymorpha]|uniref:uncharacterized protein LOC127852411 n=1 Tax=Dreissena polymorpha TaxID=45954 RepID=UPI002263B5A0|nr:uncharacterized protein LOC127852411 [Dreissena polymorpha]
MLWTETAKCDIKYACESFTCSSLVDCDSCSVKNDLFYTNNMFIYKRACLDGPCGPCDINRYCADAGESYSYLISCVTSDGRLTTGTASQTSSLLFYADIDPPFSFDPNIGDSIQIGQSIQGTGQILNRITSDPQEEPDDYDTITFYISGSSPSWLAVDSSKEERKYNGNIKVVTSLSAETEASYMVTFCAENRRGFKVFKNECEDNVCEPTDISKFCVDANEFYDYTVSCWRLNDNYSGFTTGTAYLTKRLSFCEDVNQSFAFASECKSTFLQVCL